MLVICQFGNTLLAMRLDSRTAIYCHELLHKKYAPNSFPGLTPDQPDPVVEEFKTSASRMKTKQ
jgi:hypothetical protein